MARTIAQIQNDIIAQKNADATLSAALTSTSKVAMWRLWTYITAFFAWVNENLFDAHKAEVADIIAKQKPHSRQWYVEKIKAFQKGYALPDDSDVYATVTDDATVRIITSANAVELPAQNKVRLKVATGDAGALEPLEPADVVAAQTYIDKVKDAGVRVEVTSGNPDDLKVSLQIVYDPLVLLSDGSRIDLTDSEPVKTAINEFLSNIPFDGKFVLLDFVNYIDAVEGVKTLYVESASANYGVTPYVDITLSYTPDAGYMALNETFFDANVEYIPG